MRKLKYIILLLFIGCEKSEQCDCYEIKVSPYSGTSDTFGEWEILREFKDDCLKDGDWIRDEHNSIKSQIRCL